MPPAIADADSVGLALACIPNYVKLQQSHQDGRRDVVRGSGTNRTRRILHVETILIGAKCRSVEQIADGP